MMNAIDLLRVDHARVQALFRQYDAAGEQQQQQRELTDQIFTELAVMPRSRRSFSYLARSQLGSLLSG
jgi:hypothetical protein